MAGRKLLTWLAQTGTRPQTLMERLAQLPESLPGGPVPDYFVPGPGFEGEETAEELRERFSKDPSGAVPPPAPKPPPHAVPPPPRVLQKPKPTPPPAAPPPKPTPSPPPKPTPPPQPSAAPTTEAAGRAQAAARAHLCGKQPVSKADGRATP